MHFTFLSGREGVYSNAVLLQLVVSLACISGVRGEVRVPMLWCCSIIIVVSLAGPWLVLLLQVVVSALSSYLRGEG